ncbi:hypothetical protein [Deinococcus apachensis]|uniref:hypothetical protein n=1 Tax=Deinococcus apachensis TaxID=309886 RepID=UPI00037231DC|nr:hypothetical protein [Deinococcus apachensis]
MICDLACSSASTSSASIAGLLAALTGLDAGVHRDALGMGGDSRVLLISTEGATDLQGYARIVGTRVPGISP